MPCQKDYFYSKSMEECQPCGIICDDAEMRQSLNSCLGEKACNAYYKSVNQTTVASVISDTSSNIPYYAVPIVTIVVLLCVVVIGIKYYKQRQAANQREEQEYQTVPENPWTQEETGDTTIVNVGDGDAIDSGVASAESDNSISTSGANTGLSERQLTGNGQYLTCTSDRSSNSAFL